MKLFSASVYIFFFFLSSSALQFICSHLALHCITALLLLAMNMYVQVHVAIVSVYLMEATEKKKKEELYTITRAMIIAPHI